MRFLSLNSSMLLLISMCIMMQQQSASAKPFIFKFFVPQAPARTESSTSSGSSSSSFGIDFGSILSTKLNLLTSLLRTGLSSGVSGGFNFGFKKLLPTMQISTTRRPSYTSTTIKIADDEYEPDSITKSSLTTTTTSAATDTSHKNDKTSGSDNLSEPIDREPVSNKQVTTEKLKNINNESKVTSEKIEVEDTKNIDGEDAKLENATTTRDQIVYDYITSKEPVKSSSNINGETTFKTNDGYNYDYSNQVMNENEISNEIMAISNQYLPTY